jgi:hypothetical protein
LVITQINRLHKHVNYIIETLMIYPKKD